MNTEISGVLSGSQFISQSEFAQAVARAARLFDSLGVREEVSVGLLMRNDPTFLIAQAAAVAAGAYPVPLNWHSSADDIAYVLRDADIKVLVAHADLVVVVRNLLPKGCLLVVVPTPDEVCAAFNLDRQHASVCGGDIDWSMAILEHSPEPFVTQRGERGGMYYTSGTTGKPKGVMRRPVDAAGAARMSSIVDEIFGVQRDETVRVLVSAPLYHAAPNFFANRGAEPGSLAVLMPRFNAQELLRLIEAHLITHLYLVPTMMIKLLELPVEIRTKYDLGSLRRVSHSAAPCPWATKARMIEWLGPLVYEFYGGTENGCVTQLNSHDAHLKPGSVGKLMKNAELRIYDDTGKVLGAREKGEIYAKNFNLPDFTYKNLDGKRAEVERDSLISLGDVGYLDEEGYLYLCDRKKDMIIAGGVNIYPAQIEAALQPMPGVADCAVFGVPDPTFGEVVCAHVQPHAGLAMTEADVANWLKGKLPSYEQPKIIHIVQTLPREESGKIMKRKIRDSYWADAGRFI